MNLFDPTRYTGNFWFEDPGTAAYPPKNYIAARSRIKTMYCPSDSWGTQSPNNNAFGANPGTHGTVIGPSFRNDSSGMHLGWWYDDWNGAEAFFPAGQTDYVGVGGLGKGNDTRTGTAWWPYTRWEGIFTNRSDVSVGTVPDGTSNTLLYGETTGRTFGSENNAFDRGWFGTGCLPTYWGLANGPNSLWYQFSSNHTGIVQFAYADGSVHGLRVGSTAISPGAGGGTPSTDWIVYQQMAGYKDGTTVNVSQIGN
jgi:hypothetical protein